MPNVHADMSTFHHLKKWLEHPSIRRVLVYSHFRYARLFAFYSRYSRDKVMLMDILSIWLIHTQHFDTDTSAKTSRPHLQLVTSCFILLDFAHRYVHSQIC
jgi:hypothetical protein